MNHLSTRRPISAGDSTFDLIIVGAGAMGSAAAYHAACDGLKVLLLEQYHLGHQLGSSHGGSRIVRYTHDENWSAAQMPATFALWRELEQAVGNVLLQPTQGLYLGQPDEPWLVRSQAVMRELGFDYQVLNNDALQQTHPQFMTKKGWVGVRQDNTGILAADACVAAMVDQARIHGATLQEETTVVAIEPDGAGVVVKTSQDDTYHAAHAIVAAGAWSSQFLEPLLDFPIPLRVTRQQVAYFPARNPTEFDLDAFPVFIMVADPHIYGFPIFERPGQVKVALEQSELTTTPEAPRRVDDNLLGQLSAAIRSMIPGLDPTPSHVEPCLYTESPQRHFIIDRHPVHPQIILAAGFSGRGFKHSIAIGRVLVDLAQSEADVYASPFWHESYRLNRFHSSSV